MKNILVIIGLFCLFASPTLAQDDIKIELKGDEKPDIYIDGKKYDYSIFSLLDQNKIESITVIKDKQAVKKYNAPNGVIVIKTKESMDQIVTIDKKKIKIKDTDLEPVIIIDGKVADKDTLSKLSPDDIDSIEVLKGEKAIEKYSAPNGVVIIKTK